MSTLELKVPPPVVALLMAAALWPLSSLALVLDVPSFIRITLAVLIALLGGAFSLAGVISFRRAKTTVNPMKPEKASSLVTSGVYAITRNPIYVGLLLVLVAWAVFLSSVVALAGPVAFLLYIGRFQIAPEERILSKMFGPEFIEYQARVRRWL